MVNFLRSITIVKLIDRKPSGQSSRKAQQDLRLEIIPRTINPFERVKILAVGRNDYRVPQTVSRILAEKFHQL